MLSILRLQGVQPIPSIKMFSRRIPARKMCFSQNALASIVFAGTPTAALSFAECFDQQGNNNGPCLLAWSGQKWANLRLSIKPKKKEKPINQLITLNVVVTLSMSNLNSLSVASESFPTDLYVTVNGGFFLEDFCLKTAINPPKSLLSFLFFFHKRKQAFTRTRERERGIHLEKQKWRSKRQC